MSEEILRTIGISDKEIPKIIKNSKLLNRILEAVKASGIIESNVQKANKGALIIKLCQKEVPNMNLVAQYIGNEKIITQEQLDAAIAFVISKPTFEIPEFEENAGVGIVVTDEQIAAAVTETIQNSTDLIKQKGKKAVLADILNGLKSNKLMKFAARAKTVAEVKKQLDALPDEAPAPKPEKAAPKAEAKLVKPAQQEAEEEEPVIDFQGIVAGFPSPQDNALENAPEIQAEHLRITEGNYMTRFPPEPNGWIHIGHAKAMYLDFGLAELKGGKCYMRFDDTNPAKEKDEFIEGIKYDVTWMGFKWWKITHTSDYFHQLYDFAIELIKNDLAYVCHHTKAEIAEMRKSRTPSKWRNRPAAESLREFELMKCGYYSPSEATLRLKMDYLNDNPNMHDQIAYRVIYNEHPRTKDEWCIYPTYDYSHCVIDSIEHVTHSLCTLEFENRRPSYYWVLDALKIYKPFVWEFSRLNLTHTVMSKRRLQSLVYEHLVDGWDDPRMPTVAGLRRRGFTASAIRNFVKTVGFTRNVKSTIDYAKFEQVQRTEFDETSPRAFGVLHPLKVTITDLDAPIDVEAPLFPKKPELGSRKMVLDKIVYIEADDFMEVPQAGFKRLTPKSKVGLKYANLQIEVVEVVKNGDEVVELKCRKVDSGKAQTYIHWVSTGAVKAELRLYENLFVADDPMALGDSWRENINTESKIILKNCLLEPSLGSAKIQDHFQFERTGFFVVDQDSTPENPVFNRVIQLKSSINPASASK